MNLYDFWSEEAGQDLVEYTLLVATVCVFSAALITFNLGAVDSIWNTTQDNLDLARSIAARN